MQLGIFSNQIALSFPTSHYIRMSERVNPDYVPMGLDPDVGYLLMVATRTGDDDRNWECLANGSRDMVLQPSLLLQHKHQDFRQRSASLQGWFHALVDTAVPIDQVALKHFMPLKIRLLIDADLLVRIGKMPMTQVLKAEGVFDAETSMMNLGADTHVGLAMRLTWLIEAAGSDRPIFQLVNDQALDTFAIYLTRLHGKQVNRSRA